MTGLSKIWNLIGKIMMLLKQVSKHSSFWVQDCRILIVCFVGFVDRLSGVLRKFMLRRTKEDVENELCDKIEIDLACPMSLRQKQFYAGTNE